MPCEDPTYAISNKNLRLEQSEAFRENHPFAPNREIKAFLLVLVLTAPQNFDQRAAIRDTWTGKPPEGVFVRFVLGTGSLEHGVRDRIDRENVIYKDMLLLENFNETFQSLTEKLLESFKWADRYVDFSYVFKSDDDTFARLSKMTVELRSYPRERLYWGFFDGRAPVKKSGKWSEKDWTLCDKYLPYALGGGYVLSCDLVHYIVSNSKYLKKYNNEDVSVGAWLGPLDIRRMHDPRFDTEYKSRGCSNKYIVTHKQTTRQMRDLSNNLKQNGVLCLKEIQLTRSYIYNWQVLPSKCCIRNNSHIP